MIRQRLKISGFILSKNPVWGTFQINSYFQEWVGINKNFSIEIAPITISALDKVIQLKNERKKSTSKEECQLSNGQIGFVNYANKRKRNRQLFLPGYPTRDFHIILLSRMRLIIQ